MRVTLVSFISAEYCIRLAGALARDAEVQLVLPRDIAEPHLALLSPDVRFVAFNRPRMRQPLRQITTIRAILRAIRDFDPHVVHLQQGHLWFNLALPLLGRYPLVLTVHDARHHPGDRDSQKTPQFIFDYGFRRATQVIAHCEWMRDVLINECRVPATSVHVIQRVLVSHDEPGDGVEDERLVLFFGRIWPYKGLDFFIRAEPLISERIPGVRFVIAGAGEDFARYRRLMVHPERFEVYNEYVPHQRRAELFRQASVVVLPYLEASQSGVVPLAYMAEKPVVATNVGCLPAIVDDGETGYLVPPADERALASAVIRLLEDADLRRRLGANGRRKLETECAPRVVAQQTLSVYDRAIVDFTPRVNTGKVRGQWTSTSRQR